MMCCLDFNFNDIKCYLVFLNEVTFDGLYPSVIYGCPPSYRVCQGLGGLHSQKY